MYTIWDYKNGGAELCSADSWEAAVAWCKGEGLARVDVTITDADGLEIADAF